jgi:ABC-type transporter Mla subunit MlaD
MPQSQSDKLQAIIKNIANVTKSLDDCQWARNRARVELAETTAQTRKAMKEARTLIAEADAILAVR